MGGKQACCCGGCAVFSDGFMDSASTTLSSAWTEVSGDWEYDGVTEIDENGTEDAVILTTQKSKTKEQSVGTNISSGFSNGCVWRLIANANDTGNYHYAEVEQGATTTTFRIGKATAGSVSVIEELTLDIVVDPESGLGITICISEESFTARFSSSNDWPADLLMYQCNPSLVSDGRKAGLGNGSTNAVSYDGFTLSNFHGELGYGQCKQDQCCDQQCMCCDPVTQKERCLPHNLLVTLEATGGCSGLDGCEIPLAWVPGANYWQSDDSIDLCPCMDNAKWIFSCVQNECVQSYEGGWQYNDGEEKFNLSIFMRTGGGPCYEDACFEMKGQWQQNWQCTPFEVSFPWIGFDVDETGAANMECDCCDPFELVGAVRAIVTEAA